MNKISKQKRREEYLKNMKREIEFQFSQFKYEKSFLYLESCGTQTWYEEEKGGEEADIYSLSEMKVKTFDSFITAGMPLSFKKEIALSEVLHVIKQSLHKPLSLDIMMRIIYAQEKYIEQEWPSIHPGVLFLGSRLVVTKAIGWEDMHPHVRQSVGEVYYPAMRFSHYTRDNYGLWLPEVAHENLCDRNFSTAVYI